MPAPCMTPPPHHHHQSRPSWRVGWLLRVVMRGNDFLSEGPAQLLSVWVTAHPSKGLKCSVGTFSLQGQLLALSGHFSKDIAELVSGGASAWVLWFSQFSTHCFLGLFGRRAPVSGKYRPCVCAAGDSEHLSDPGL